MKTKELKIQAPEGYEIDREESTLDCIKFKPIKKTITYKDVCNKLFEHSYYYINDHGIIIFYTGKDKFDVNNALTSHQLKRILALNQLLNIAEYYNRLDTELHIMIDKQYIILYDEGVHEYIIKPIFPCYRHGIEVVFNRAEDAQAVINNSNFKEILDTIYKN